jgi:hypothetical protein
MDNFWNNYIFFLFYGENNKEKKRRESNKIREMIFW